MWIIKYIISNSDLEHRKGDFFKEVKLYVLLWLSFKKFIQKNFFLTCETAFEGVLMSTKSALLLSQSTRDWVAL